MTVEEIPESPNTNPPEEKAPIPISEKAVEKRPSFFSRLKFFRQISEKRQAKREAQAQTQILAGVEEDKKILSSIDQHPQKQPEDDVAALAVINRLIEAGQATDEDIHRKAVIESKNLANQEKRALTENDVVEAEARLRSKIQKEPIPFPKPAETTPTQVPKEEEVA